MSIKFNKFAAALYRRILQDTSPKTTNRKTARIELLLRVTYAKKCKQGNLMGREGNRVRHPEVFFYFRVENSTNVLVSR